MELKLAVSVFSSKIMVIIDFVTTILSLMDTDVGAKYDRIDSSRELRAPGQARYQTRCPLPGGCCKQQIWISFLQQFRAIVAIRLLRKILIN